MNINTRTNSLKLKKKAVENSTALITKLLASFPLPQAGKIISISSEYLDISCSPGILRVYEVQLQGKKRLTVKDFLNGYKLNEGVLLD